MDAQPQKPDFIVDAHGQVRDVRHLDEAQIAAALTSENTAGARTQGGRHDARASGGGSRPTSHYYLIPIPIGLLITLIVFLISNTRPNRADTAFNEGLALFNLDAFPEATAKFDEAISLNSNLCDAYDHRALAYQAQGELDTAFKDYDQAIACHAKAKRDPDASDPAASAHNNRGTAHMDVGNYEQAIADFTAAIEGRRDYQGERDFGKAYYNRGVVYSALARYEDALEDFEQALQLSQEFWMPSRPTGAPESDWSARMEEMQERNLEQQKDVSFQADRAQVLLTRSEILNKVGSYDQAIADLGEAIDLQPDPVTLAEVYTARGLAYYDRDDYDPAIADFSDAIRLLSARLSPAPTKVWHFLTPGPSDEEVRRVAAQYEADLVEVLYFRGLTYSDQGEIEPAIADFEQILTLDVDDGVQQEVNGYLDLLYLLAPDNDATPPAPASDSGYSPDDTATFGGGS